MKGKSLLDYFESEDKKNPLTARALVQSHRSEIKELLKKGKTLKAIYNTLCTMYAEEMKSEDLNLTQSHFYKLWQSINADDKPKSASKPNLKPKPEQTTEWDSTSGNKHPFEDQID